MKKNMNKGFSLVELIIVIAIMAVLVGVLAPQFIKYVESSRQSTDIDTVAALKTAIESAVIDSAADDTPIESGSIEIKTGTPCTADAKLAGTKDLADVGIAETTKLKSSGWQGGTYEYKIDTGAYAWTNTTTPNLNDKAPKKDLTLAFK